MFSTALNIQNRIINLQQTLYIEFQGNILLYGLSLNTYTLIQKYNLNHPSIIIIPQHRVSYKNNRSLCEIQYFLDIIIKKQTKINLICDKETYQSIRQLYSNYPFEYDVNKVTNKSKYTENIDIDEKIPQFEKQRKFIKNKLKNDKKLDNIFNFYLLGDRNQIEINQLKIKRKTDKFILEINKQKMEIKYENHILNYELPTSSNFIPNIYDKKLQEIRNTYIIQKYQRTRPGNFQILFINQQNSVGYIIILQYEYILVDPPEKILQILHQLNLTLQNLNSVILTSPKLINSGGILELFLNLSKLQIITQKQIFECLSKKFQSLYMIQKSTLDQKLKLKNVIIGTKINYKKLTFQFNFGFTQQLSLIFTIITKDLYIYFYGNSVYNYELVQQAVRDNIINKNRYKQLLEIKWETLQVFFINILNKLINIDDFYRLPDKIRDKICFNYRNKVKNYPKSFINLQNQLNAINIKLNNPIYSNHIQIISIIYFLKQVNFISLLQLSNCINEEILQSGQQIKDKNKFYFIKSGTIKINQKNTIKLLYKGQVFNEEQLFLQNKQDTKKILALQKSTLMVITKQNFNKIFKKSNFIQNIKYQISKKHHHLAQQPIYLFPKNSLINTLDFHKIRYLQKAAVQKSMLSGSFLWQSSCPLQYCFYIVKGNVMISSSTDNLQYEVGAGYFVGQIKNMMFNKKSETKIDVLKDGYILIIQKRNILNYIRKFPKQLYNFIEKPYFFI